MNIATALLEDIKKRGLDELFIIEEAIGKQVFSPVLCLKLNLLLAVVNANHPFDASWFFTCSFG